MVDTSHARASGDDNHRQDNRMCDLIKPAIHLPPRLPLLGRAFPTWLYHLHPLGVDSGFRRNDDEAGVAKAAESQKERQRITPLVILARGRNRLNGRAKRLRLPRYVVFFCYAQRLPARMDDLFFRLFQAVFDIITEPGAVTCE